MTEKKRGMLKDISNTAHGGKVNSSLQGKTVADVGALMKKAMSHTPATVSLTRSNPVYSPEQGDSENAVIADKENVGGMQPGATPAKGGMDTQKEAGRLAAMSVISKKNRRKSVFQRPSRYGDWFDGDDEELEQMVEDFNEEEEEGMVQGNTTGNGITTKTKSGKDDVVKQVQEITHGLCKQLDTLIEESPACHHRTIDKSLRDKLVESWEGRSYYDRLLEIAAGAKDEDASKPSSCSSGGGEQDSPVQEHGSEEGDTTPQASLLSPPKKPKGKLVRIAPLPESAKPSQKKNDVVRPVVSSVGTQKMDGKKKLQIAVPSEGSNTRKGPSAVAGPGLLRVSARGLKPMPAPWEGGQQTSSEDTPHHTMAAVTKSTSNKKSEQSTTSIAEQEKDPRDVLIEELQQKLNQMHEEAQEQQKARETAEKRIATLEDQLQEFHKDVASKSTGEGKIKMLGKAEKLEQGYFQLELQLKAIAATLENMSSAVMHGKNEAQGLTAMIKMLSTESQEESSAGTSTRRTTRSRRK